MTSTTKIYSDAELLHKLSEGCNEAFTLLYNKYWEKIYSVAYHYLLDRNMAEDIVQEVFLIIWKKRATLSEIIHIQHYLHTIARNLIISSLRKKMPAHTVPAEYAFPVEEKTWKPILELEYKETAALISEAVKQLSPRQKEIYLMSSDKDLSLKDTAVQLNISYDAARQYKSEALKVIRRFLQKNVARLFTLAASFFIS